MQKMLLAFLKNTVRARFTNSVWFDPIVATMYVTPMCNLRCNYCYDFGAQRNESFRGQLLPLAQMKRIAEMLAVECDFLYVTGGEPLMNPDIAEILAHARRSGFKYVAMNTNALLLRDNEEVLKYLDNLVISVDSLDIGRRDDTLAAQPDNIRKLLDNVRWAAANQKAGGYTLTITSVISPGLVADARRVMEFCFEIGAQFSAQHLSAPDRMPDAELDRDPEFGRFMADLLAAKRAGKPVSGSELYLNHVQEAIPYACTPTVSPRVDWMGRLAYPCRELPNHIWVDMLGAGSYRAALAEAEKQWGAPPGDCSRCGERCYVELSTLVRNPTKFASEAVGYLRQYAGTRIAKVTG